MSKNMIEEVTEAASNRRSFVRKIGIAGAALGAAATVAVKSASAQTTTDVDVLNFALNLEFLEAEFYTVATTGKTLAAAGYNVGPNPGPTTGGNLVNFSNNLVFSQQVALEIAADERAHVALLLNALGASAIKKPAINLNALGFGFGSLNDFLKLARIFEDIGVTAYAGAAPLLSPTILMTAAKILAAEAEHVANIRLQIARLNIPTAPPLDGVDILPPPSKPNQFFSLDANGLAKVRTPGQVLALAYGAPNASSGGFFPMGANGFYTTSSSAA
jgi:Ferritin-like domain